MGLRPTFPYPEQRQPQHHQTPLVHHTPPLRLRGADTDADELLRRLPLPEAEDQSKPDDSAEMLDEMMKALIGSPRRWILCALALQPRCERDLCDVLGYTKSAISQYLSYLSRRNIVQFDQEGSKKVFSLATTTNVSFENGRVIIVLQRQRSPWVILNVPMDEVILAKLRPKSSPQSSPVASN